MITCLVVADGGIAERIARVLHEEERLVAAGVEVVTLRERMDAARATVHEVDLVNVVLRLGETEIKSEPLDFGLAHVPRPTSRKPKFSRALAFEHARRFR